MHMAPVFFACDPPCLQVVRRDRLYCTLPENVFRAFAFAIPYAFFEHFRMLDFNVALLKTVPERDEQTSGRNVRGKSAPMQHEPTCNIAG